MTGDVNVPTGWTAIGSFIGGTSNAIWAQYRLAQVGDTSWTWTLAHGTTANLGVILQSFSGVDQTTPIDATGTTVTSSNQQTVTVATYNTATANAWELIAMGCASWGVSPVFSATGFTAADNSPATNQAAGLLYLGPKVSAGATGSVVATVSGSGSGQKIDAIPFAICAAVPPFTLPPTSILKPYSRPRLAGPQFAHVYG